MFLGDFFISQVNVLPVYRSMFALTVYFVPWNVDQNLLLEAERLYKKAGTFNCIKKGDLVAVKLHVGELGNPSYVQPFFVHHIIQKVKEAGGKPFLTDSNTYYLHNATTPTTICKMP